MPEVKENTSKEIVVNKNYTMRYSSVLAKNGISFYNQFGKDGHYISDILYYIAYIYQTDFRRYYQSSNPSLFHSDPDGFISFEFNVNEFCELLGYKKPNLQKPSLYPSYLVDHFGKKFTDKISHIEYLGDAKSPHKEENMNSLLSIILQYNPDAKIDLEKIAMVALKEKALTLEVEAWRKKYPESVHWKTVLDNAIYRLGTEKIKFRFDGANEAFSASTAGGVEFITQVTKLQNKQKKNQVYYTFLVNKKFESQLIKMYSLIHLQNLINARKPNLKYLYEYVVAQSRVARLNENQEYKVDMNLLCELAMIDINDHRDAKQKLKQKFNKLKSKMGLPVDLKFEKGKNDNWNYRPVIVYPKQEYSDEEKKKRTNLYYSSFRTYCVHELFRFFKDRYDSIHFEKFEQWCHNLKIDPEKKLQIYNECHNIFFSEAKGGSKEARKIAIQQFFLGIKI